MAARAPKVKPPTTDGTGMFGQAPAMGGLNFAEYGSSGLRQFSGWVRENFLPQLQGRRAATVYREMSENSPIIGSILFAVIQAMRTMTWRTVAASDKPEAIAEANFAESLRHDMSHPWTDFVTEALTMLTYGFSVHEIVYKRRDGRSLEPGAPSSKFNDGRIGLRKLPLRGQDTVLKWFFGPNGEILGLTQQPYTGPLIDLSMEKCLLFRPSAHKNNPEGVSILRTSYRPYYFLKRLEEQEAILFERLSGLPVCYVPNSLLEGAAAGDDKAVQALAAYKSLVTNTRIDEQMGAILPSDTYQDADGKYSNVRMYELQLMTPQASRSNVSSDKAIARYKLDILMTVLCDFLMMGHEVRGTNNLAVVKVDMFYAAIQGWLSAISSTCNRHMLPRIWRLNALNPDLMPEYQPDQAQRLDLDSLGAFIANLANSGMALFPDDELESFIRDAAGLPELPITDPAIPSALASTPETMKRMVMAKAARQILTERRKRAPSEVGKSAAGPFALAPDPSASIDEREKEEDDENALFLLLLALLGAHAGFIVGRHLGSAAKIPAPEALQQYAQKRAKDILAQINDTTVKRLRETIAAGQAAGETQDEVRQRVEDVFAAAAKDRAPMIGMTESTALTGAASLAAASENQVASNEWVTMRDSKVRDAHMVMDGQIQNAGMPFVAPGGERALAPGGFGIADLDINCRCILVPVPDVQKARTDEHDAHWKAHEAERVKADTKITDFMRRMFDSQRAALLSKFPDRNKK